MGTPRLLFNVPDATNDAQNLGGLWWGNVARDGQRVVYSVAPKGASAPADPISQLALLDRQGQVLRPIGPTGRYGQPALSPDGTRIATRWFDTFAPADVPTSGSLTSPPARRRRSERCPARLRSDVVAGRQADLLRVRARERLSGDLPQGRRWYRRGRIDLPLRTGCAGEPAGHLVGWQVSVVQLGRRLLVVPLAGGDATTRKAIELSREEFLVNGGVLLPDARLIVYTSNETESFEL